MIEGVSERGGGEKVGDRLGKIFGVKEERRRYMERDRGERGRERQVVR